MPPRGPAALDARSSAGLGLDSLGQQPAAAVRLLALAPSDPPRARARARAAGGSARSQRGQGVARWKQARFASLARARAVPTREPRALSARARTRARCCAPRPSRRARACASDWLTWQKMLAAALYCPLCEFVSVLGELKPPRFFCRWCRSLRRLGAGQHARCVAEEGAWQLGGWAKAGSQQHGVLARVSSRANFL